MTARRFALVDGNAFYCPCERATDPRLEHRPAIVLSNNGGCAVVRTAEAKTLAITMGEPYFKICHLREAEGVVALSSNYALYGDISRRMNAIYDRFSPDVELYSMCRKDASAAAIPAGRGKASATRRGTPPERRLPPGQVSWLAGPRLCPSSRTSRPSDIVDSGSPLTVTGAAPAPSRAHGRGTHRIPPWPAGRRQREPRQAQDSPVSERRKM